MKEVQLIANDYPSRMKEILDEAWKVFKWQFANKAFVKEIENEAPFQLHFASIIRSIGNMYVLHGETFYVDLETKWEGKTDESCEKKKYIDITCGFYKLGEAIPQYACAIELKFKRKDYGALPHNLFAIYKDIESIESEVLATVLNLLNQRCWQQERRVMTGIPKVVCISLRITVIIVISLRMSIKPKNKGLLGIIGISHSG